eukprot:1633920-Amphidinium_carterae.1
MQLLREGLESPDCRPALWEMKGKVWPLSKNFIEGSRLVQLALQVARGEGLQSWPLQELHGHVLAAS